MTPEQVKEAEQASTLFHIALIQMGAMSVEDTLALWEDVPPIPTDGGARATERWLATAVRYVMRRRLRSRDLALAYYRYQRALATGRTIALPGQDNPPHMTLPELKREFEAYLNPPEDPAPEDSGARAVDGETQAVSEPADELPVAPVEPEADVEEEEDDLEQILVEEIEELQAELDALEAQAEAEIEAAIQALGPNNMNRKMRQIHPDSADQVDSERQAAHTQAGRRQAATAAREVMNGARGPLFLVGDRDRRVIGFARVSRTGTPCGFCAMLISRGFTPRSGLYTSAEGSSVETPYGDLDLYHDNCQCYAVPIYSRAQMAGDMFALNRKYADLWPIVTRGLGGKAAISAWRRFIRQEAKSQKAQEAAA